MKRKYVVIMFRGYYIAENKKDAINFLLSCIDDAYIIHTRSQEGNYYHNRVKIIADKEANCSFLPKDHPDYWQGEVTYGR